MRARLKWLLVCGAVAWLWSAAAGAQEDLPVELTADEMIYEQELDIVTARGSVEIVQGERILFADTVSYNQRDDVVTASGNVVLQEPTGDVLFSDYVELSDGFKQGIVRELRIRLSNNARLSARNARREGEDRTILEKAVFTRCEECEDGSDRAPIWQIKARRVTRDLEKEIVEYDDATVELFGVPVLYTPYFFHPDPTVERKSGLLAPVFGASGELGAQYTQPVYLVIDESSDLTLSPRVTSKEGVVLAAEYRQQFLTGLWESDGSITYVDKIDANNIDTGDNQFRGHFRTKGDFRLNPQFDWGFNIFRTSDDTYLRRYDIRGGTLLQSTAYLTGFNGRHFAGIEGFSFQDLSDGAKEGEIPIVLPLASFKASGEPALIGGRVDVGLSGVALQRTGGRDTRRMSFNGTWERQFVDGLGGLTTTGLHLQADGYSVSESQDTDPTASLDDYFEGRVWPMATLDWRLPLVRSGERVQQFIEPRVQFIASPAGGNPNDIPNEDSQSFEFTDANLFSRNRFTGHDRIESGSRVNYGLTASLLGERGGSSEFVIGQSYRFNETSAFGNNTGLESNLSDVVGRISISPTTNFSYTFRYRIDIDGFQLDRHEHNFRYTGEIFDVDLGYISLPQINNGIAAGNTDELTFEGSARIARHWQVLGGYRGNLNGGDAVRIEAGLRYLDECFDFQFGGVRDFTADRDAEATTSFFVRFRLKGLN
ncbi:LPS-assembly protein LptD [Minwuia sp.]|uniref:LPS-assembly protein LptD n=1 Tax=Minwuia sp. TaxID=2493630 RepID=UPI003A9328BB